MIIRTLHGGKPFYLGEKCQECCGHQICTDDQIIVVNEEDEGELWDITFWRSTAIFLDKPELKGLLVNLIEKYYEEGPGGFCNALANLAGGVAFTEWGTYDITKLKEGFTVKPATIIVIDDGKFADILFDMIQNPYSSIEDGIRKYAYLVVEMGYATPMLWYLAYLYKDEVAKIIHDFYLKNLNYSFDLEEIKKEFYIPSLDISVTEYISNIVHYLCWKIEDYDLAERCQYMKDQVADEVFFYVEKLVEKGEYPEPYLQRIVVSRDWRVYLEGCEAAKAVYELLPERDRIVVRENCGV